MRRFYVCLFVCLVALVFAATASSQEASASLATEIKGLVTDPSGAPAPNATVSLTSNVAPTQIQQTDASGAFSFRGLRAGTYKLLVSLSGFNDYESSPIVLAAGYSATQAVQLEVAGSQTTVTVTGAPPQIEVSDPTVSSTLEAPQIAATPLNGRNFLSLIALAPGVSNQTGQDEAKVGVQGSAAFSVNGGRTEYNSYELDGSDLLNVGFNAGINTLVVYPSLDSIGEMKILTSNYGAMYGRTASGIVMLNTKSGTSDLHGDVYYFIRNEAFNARNFFDQTKGAPLYRRNDFGATLGGPIFIPGVYNKAKDKTFFFASEEYRGERSPTQFQQAVPTAAERQGDFRSVCPVGAGPVTGAQYPLCPSVGGVYTPILLSQGGLSGESQPNRNAQAILSTGTIPLPNSTVGCNSLQSSCYVDTVSEPTRWRQELFRIDHYLNENNRLMFRYAHDSWSTVTPTPQFGVVENTVPTIQNNFNGPGTSLVGRYSQTLSPTLLNEFFFSYVNSNITLTDSNGPGGTWQRPSQLDLPCQTVMYTPAGSSFPQQQLNCPIGSIFPNADKTKVPGVEFINDPLFGGGVVGFDAGYMPWKHTNPVYSFGDSMSKQLGKHFLQFGSEFLLSYRRQTNSVTGTATGETQGLYQYSSLAGGLSGFQNFIQEDPVPGSNGTLAPFGNQPVLNQDSGQATYRQRFQIAEPFFQDDWKVTPHFTLNLGLRISLFGRYHEANDNAYNWVASKFDPVLASQVTFGPFGNNLLYSTPFANGVSDLGQQNAPLAFDPNNPAAVLLNGVVRCGYNGVPSGCMSSHVFNPAPRVGFAWDVFGDGKSSLRAGYGVFFEHGTGSEANTGSLEGAPPLVYNATSTANDISCIGGLLPECNSGTSGVNEAFPLNLTHVQTKGVWPYVQQWSISFQHEFPAHVVASVAYVGSKGTHLTAELDGNDLPGVPSSQNPFLPGQPFNQTADCEQFVSGSGSSATSAYLVNGNPVPQGTAAYQRLGVLCNNNANINALRPYFAIGQILDIENVANSSYRSFQATINKRAGPLNVGVSYTYGYSYDDASDRFDPIPDASNLHSNWAPSNFDQRNLLSVTYLYTLPFFKSSTNAGLKTALGGWQWGGITVFQSGQPFSVINEVIPDNAVVGSGTGIASLNIGSYPDLAGDPNTKAAAQNVAGVYGPLLYNPAAFEQPRGLTFGNAGRNSLRNLDRWNFDMSLFKNIPVSGERSLQFRAEAFNVFNTTQFEIYNPARGNQANNEISCYAGATNSAGDPSCLAGSSFLRPIDAHRPRTLQLALKFVF